jgi:hypothetical protein
MKIVLVSNLYPPNTVGGYERLSALVASELAKRGHQISVLTSDYGPANAVIEEFPVERSLRLLVSGNNIYEPFTGTLAERHAISQQNIGLASRKLTRERPDVVLVGNLYFLDSSFLEAFRPMVGRLAYLLTDIWMLHFMDAGFVQDFFRGNVFEPAANMMPLVPADPPALVLDRVETAESWRTYAVTMANEMVRRRRVEMQLAAGRSVFQIQGTCYLCGPSSFLIRRAGPATLALAARDRSESYCTGCGLAGSIRGALHALDELAAAPEPNGILVAIQEKHARQLLQKRYPRCITVPSVLDLGNEGSAAPGSFRHAVSLEGTVSLDDAARKLRLLAASVVPGGTVVLSSDFAPPQEQGQTATEPAWDLLGHARAAGLGGCAAYLYWSTEYGYLGSEHVVYGARAS